jgi:hypothetical protein
MQKTLQISKVSKHNSIEQIFEEVEKTKSFEISELNWIEKFTYKPFCKSKIGWNENGIYLFFHVKEQQTLAKETEIHGTVCNDSCVEFFVSFDNCKTYYNFEFNAIGSIHACYRASDMSFKNVLSNTELLKIKVLSSFEKFKAINLENTDWKIKIHIPTEIINDIQFFEKNCFGNFYKCGDKLNVPHYLSWNKIVSEKPSFHKPEFFGRIELLK